MSSPEPAKQKMRPPKCEAEREIRSPTEARAYTGFRDRRESECNTVICRLFMSGVPSVGKRVGKSAPGTGRAADRGDARPPDFSTSESGPARVWARSAASRLLMSGRGSLRAACLLPPVLLLLPQSDSDTTGLAALIAGCAAVRVALRSSGEPSATTVSARRACGQQPNR